jgi:hypothetical protein
LRKTQVPKAQNLGTIFTSAHVGGQNLLTCKDIYHIPQFY